jgi:DNA-binding CsgD family transcriptional regulator
LPNGLLVVTTSGRIRCANLRIRRWLDQYFALSHTTLSAPAAIRLWLMNKPDPAQPMVLARNGCRLMLRLLHVDSDGTFCLLLSERDNVGAPVADDELTPREQEVMWLVASGATDREVAGALDIALPTVRRHLENVFDKLEVNNRTRAVAAFLRSLQAAG